MDEISLEEAVALLREKGKALKPRPGAKKSAKARPAKAEAPAKPEAAAKALTKSAKAKPAKAKARTAKESV